MQGVAKKNSPLGVALLAEGVDRNFVDVDKVSVLRMSPSSQRAWIEIFWGSRVRRKVESPSSRRAWIEMLYVG